MKYFVEIRHYNRRTPSSFPMEDFELGTPKHEISETAYLFLVNELFKDKKRLKNSDGSFSYSSTLNCHEFEETTFYIEN